jgi:N-acetylmuramoyl-L-alanine amidase
MDEDIKNFLMELSEINILSRTLCGEARGESIQGQVAVVNTILNRYKNDRKKYGKTIHDVCLKRYQYSCWNESDPNFNKLIQLECYDSVQRVIAGLGLLGLLVDNSKGATHYHTKQIIPSWIKDPTKMQKTVEIGNHIFYVEI